MGGLKMKLNKTMLLPVLGIGFTVMSCATPAPHYKFSISLIEPVKSESLRYEDHDIRVFFQIGTSQISFNFENLTETPIKIPWDDLIYISPSARSMRVIHGGIRLIDRNNSQVPTTVAPKSRISDILIPSDHIYFVQGKYGGWRENDLFVADAKEIYQGTFFGLYFPIDFAQKRKEYHFRFLIKEVTQLK